MQMTAKAQNNGRLHLWNLKLVAFKTERRQTKEELPNLRSPSGASADPCAAGGKAAKAREALAGLPSIW